MQIFNLFPRLLLPHSILHTSKSLRLLRQQNQIYQAIYSAATRVHDNNIIGGQFDGTMLTRKRRVMILPQVVDSQLRMKRNREFEMIWLSRSTTWNLGM